MQNIGGTRFPSTHLDPAGRWVVPADGRYLILIRNLIGGLENDSRRVYQLSVRREEPDFHLAVVSQLDSPASLNVRRGGRSIVDVLAFRRR
ncbi:MAG: pre-peptidase, partial [Planctomycetes bacterium]|nr:pre-peptidase [Planctomycetota bacterium]